MQTSLKETEFLDLGFKYLLIGCGDELYCECLSKLHEVLLIDFEMCITNGNIVTKFIV